MESADIIRAVSDKNPTNISFIPNSAIMAAEREANAAAKQQTNPIFVNLAGHIEGCFQANKSYREQSGVDRIMIRSLAQRNSEYDQEKLVEIMKQGGTNVFIGMTGVKCRAAEAWMNDVMMGEVKPWRLKPTPIPDLPGYVAEMITETVMARWEQDLSENQTLMEGDAVYQLAADMREEVIREMREDAEKRAKRMEVKIEDQFVEGGYKKAFDEAITDLVTLKAGIIKGPIVRKKAKIVWVKSQLTGRTTHKVEDKIVREWERVSPFDAYPAAGSESCQDGDFVERVRFSRKSLNGLKGTPNYIDDAINLVISQYGKGGLSSTWTSIDQQRAELESKGDMSERDRSTIEGIEYWGSVQGSMLIDFGYRRDQKGNRIMPLDEYEVNAIKIGQYIVYVTVNDDPLGRRPYSHSGWGKIPGSFWYQGVPELMYDLQRICNAAVRSLVNNMAISSGPQVIIDDINRLAKGQNITSLRPWKIWQFVNNIHSQLKAIDFFQPTSNAKDLMAVFDHFMRLADDFTGIPAYTYGNERVAGAGRTASGLSMLMNSAARGIKKVIARMDIDLLSPSIMKMFEHNMLYDDDESIKGDVTVDPQGILAMIIKEQMASQRMEYLAATANPIDQEIMGMEGRANLLRAAAEPLQMGPREIIPPDDKIRDLARRDEERKEQMRNLELRMAEMQSQMAAA